MYVIGDAGEDDFSIDNHRLRVSDAALALLGRFDREHCDVHAGTWPSLSSHLLAVATDRLRAS